MGGPGPHGGAEILLRAGIAALLNSASPSISYPLTTAQVIAQVDAALATEDRPTMIALADQLDMFNNLHCPLDQTIVAGGILGVQGANKLTLVGGIGVALLVKTLVSGKPAWRVTFMPEVNTSTSKIFTWGWQVPSPLTMLFLPKERIISLVPLVVDIFLVNASNTPIDPFLAAGGGGGPARIDLLHFTIIEGGSLSFTAI